MLTGAQLGAAGGPLLASQNINMLQQAAIAAQAALQNPLLMAQAAPWLNPAALHLGLVNPAASAAALAGAQLGQLPQLPVPNGAGAGGPTASPMLDATLAAQLAPPLPMDPTAANPLLFYQNQGQDWSRADARGLAAGLQVGHAWQEQLAAAARQRGAGFPGPAAAL